MKARRLNIILLCMISTQLVSLAQQRGEFVFTLGIGFISHGGIGAKYFVADGLAVEIHAQAIPHTYNLGIACNIHPIGSDRNEYLIVGISKFGGSNPFPRCSIRDGDTLTSTAQSATGLNFGLGHQFRTREKDVFGFFALGATDILSSQEEFRNTLTHASVDIEDSSHVWLPFVEGGVSAYTRFEVRGGY